MEAQVTAAEWAREASKVIYAGQNANLIETFKSVNMKSEMTAIGISAYLEFPRLDRVLDQAQKWQRIGDDAIQSLAKADPKRP